ncbi:uncharacterized protein LOC131317225 [Rhododendron vialii]|uniref:uncharacterized protein LOC131317225 n=1 Tax=Rhododendron vialii TaxID=182163 RepID=UPI00266055AD|nr:uncharacterized protein LOC131317225 [Rhododendron vialii]
MFPEIVECAKSVDILEGAQGGVNETVIVMVLRNYQLHELELGKSLKSNQINVQVATNIQFDDCCVCEFLTLSSSKVVGKANKDLRTLSGENSQGVSSSLVKLYHKLPSPDYLTICQCLMLLDDPEGVSSILKKLLRSENKDDALLAFQIAFDLVENENQAFLLNVKNLYFLGTGMRVLWEDFF